MEAFYSPWSEMAILARIQLKVAPEPLHLQLFG